MGIRINSMATTKFLSGRPVFQAAASREVCNGSRLFMKQKYSLNVQIIPGERENFEVSERRFDREVQNAAIMREVKRNSAERTSSSSSFRARPPSHATPL